PLLCIELRTKRGPLLRGCGPAGDRLARLTHGGLRAEAQELLNLLRRSVLQIKRLQPARPVPLLLTFLTGFFPISLPLGLPFLAILIVLVLVVLRRSGCCEKHRAQSQCDRGSDPSMCHSHRVSPCVCLYWWMRQPLWAMRRR